MEIAEMMLVMEKRDPSFSSWRLNFSWKKYVTQELDTTVSCDPHGKLNVRKNLTKRQGRMQMRQEQTAGTG